MKKITKRIIYSLLFGLPLLTAIAIVLPCILTHQTAMNETSAFLSLKDLYDAQMKFRSNSGAGKYGSLGELGAAGLIDNALAGGIKEGYRFEMIVEADKFQAFATPLVYGRMGFTATGSRSFYIDEKRIFTEADKNGGRASSSDEPF